MTVKTKNKQVNVKNVNGTSQKDCKCGSWLQHWLNYSGQKADSCKVKGCTNTDLLGVHVQKNVSYDRNWYIVPLCREHSKKSDLLELEDGTYLVSAHKSLTCG